MNDRLAGRRLGELAHTLPTVEKITRCTLPVKHETP